MYKREHINQSGLTPKRLAVLREIANFASSRCYSATIAELSASLNVSRPTVFEHIAALREEGLLKRSDGRVRSLHLTVLGKRVLESARQQRDCRQTGRGSSIELYGRISAGYGIDAVEDKRAFGLTELFGRDEDLFALQVQGESMKGAGINDGDYLICRWAQTADDGQIVVALVEEDRATVKRFFREKKRARLMPSNDAFEPIYSQNCRIQGVVVGLVRRL